MPKIWRRFGLAPRTPLFALATENRVYHRPNLAEVVHGDFDRIADNVGYTALVAPGQLQPGRRRHPPRLGRAHVGDRELPEGVHRRVPLYRDIDGSAHERAIGRLFLRGANRGCTASRFCTRSTPSRAYVAAVIDRATGTRSTSSYVSSTCGSDWYCRNTEVTRRQLAMMVGSALDLEPVEGSQFTDIAQTNHAEINAVVGAGLMTGCASDRFCPGRTVTRAQIASVVNRAID